jgi:hypothetical protein
VVEEVKDQSEVLVENLVHPDSKSSKQSLSSTESSVDLDNKVKTNTSSSEEGTVWEETDWVSDVFDQLEKDTNLKSTKESKSPDNQDNEPENGNTPSEISSFHILSSSSSSDTEIESETDEMGDTNLSPHSFGGTVSEDADDWFRHYIRYVEYRELTDARKLALFKVLLKGTAGDWLDTLSIEITNDYEQLMAAFKARYQNPDKERYRSAKDLFT